MKKALIIGITGQDGSYLAEHLFNLGYCVHGLVRRTSMFSRSRIEHMRNSLADAGERLVLHYGDLNDPGSLRRILREIAPDEVYHLAGQSHVGLSFEIPEVTCQENGMSTLALIEIIRDMDRPVRLYHAASSEVFGAPPTSPQNEDTPFRPINPYGCAKAFATQMCRIYRDAYGLFLCNGIAYNHESPRRGENFVTRKISAGVARIRAGLQSSLVLGNLDARRDWGWAPEYVQAIWATLQREKPGDYVLATGRACSVREFVKAAFQAVDIEVAFEAKGHGEIGRRLDTGGVVVTVDARYIRPTEPFELVGDSARARRELAWSPKILADEVARLMVRADCSGIEA